MPADVLFTRAGKSHDVPLRVQVKANEFLNVGVWCGRELPRKTKWVLDVVRHRSCPKRDYFFLEKRRQEEHKKQRKKSGSHPFW